jgi:hypothetical protein
MYSEYICSLRSLTIHVADFSVKSSQHPICSLMAQEGKNKFNWKTVYPNDGSKNNETIVRTVGRLKPLSSISGLRYTEHFHCKCTANLHSSGHILILDVT